jgi:hypothetical protein
MHPHQHEQLLLLRGLTEVLPVCLYVFICLECVFGTRYACVFVGVFVCVYAKFACVYVCVLVCVHCFV